MFWDDCNKQVSIKIRFEAGPTFVRWLIRRPFSYIFLEGVCSYTRRRCELSQSWILVLTSPRRRIARHRKKLFFSFQLKIFFLFFCNTGLHLSSFNDTSPPPSVSLTHWQSSWRQVYSIGLLWASPAAGFLSRTKKNTSGAIVRPQLQRKHWNKKRRREKGMRVPAGLERRDVHTVYIYIGGMLRKQINKTLNASGGSEVCRYIEMRGGTSKDPVCSDFHAVLRSLFMCVHSTWCSATCYCAVIYLRAQFISYFFSSLDFSLLYCWLLIIHLIFIFFFFFIYMSEKSRIQSGAAH